MATPRTLPRFWALLLLLSALGCGDEDLLLPKLDESTGLFVVERSVGGGLVHTVLLSHAEVAPGDTLRITSVVTNRGSAPVRVKLANPFGLEVEGGYEGGSFFLDFRTVTLEVGQSRQSRGDIILRSPPGVYRAQLQHLVDPSFRLLFDLRVRG